MLGSDMKFSTLSDNSSVTQLVFQNSVVSCLYNDSISGLCFKIEIKCPVGRNCFYSGIPVGILDCATAKLESVSDYFNIKSGRYISNDKDNQAKMFNNGSVIALGLKAVDFPFIATIRMPVGATFLSVPVHSEDDIKLKEIDCSEFKDAVKNQEYLKDQ